MKKTIVAFSLLVSLVVAAPAHADNCKDLPSYDTLRQRLIAARTSDNGGLNLDMWATVIDRSGIVCAVVFSGAATDSQWPGSRVISAQKANTANAFSLGTLALSTANLYSAVQPGGPLFGLQESNPVDTTVAYSGFASDFGSKRDPMVGKRIGGVNVFGGGLALYNQTGQIVGAIGVSGDTSCADHNIAWKMRRDMSLDYVPAGVSADKNDAIIYDIADGKSAGGYGHPACGGREAEIAEKLTPTRKK